MIIWSVNKIRILNIWFEVVRILIIFFLFFKTNNTIVSMYYKMYLILPRKIVPKYFLFSIWRKKKTDQVKPFRSHILWYNFLLSTSPPSRFRALLTTSIGLPASSSKSEDQPDAVSYSHDAALFSHPLSLCHIIVLLRSSIELSFRKSWSHNTDNRNFWWQGKFCWHKINIFRNSLVDRSD